MLELVLLWACTWLRGAQGLKRVCVHLSPPCMFTMTFCCEWQRGWTLRASCSARYAGHRRAEAQRPHLLRPLEEAAPGDRKQTGGGPGPGRGPVVLTGTVSV